MKKDNSRWRESLCKRIVGPGCAPWGWLGARLRIQEGFWQPDLKSGIRIHCFQAGLAGHWEFMGQKLHMDSLGGKADILFKKKKNLWPSDLALVKLWESLFGKHISHTHANVFTLMIFLVHEYTSKAICPFWEVIGYQRSRKYMLY